MYTPNFIWREDMRGAYFIRDQKREESLITLSLLEEGGGVLMISEYITLFVILYRLV